MRIVWLAALLAALAGCSSMEHSSMGHSPMGYEARGAEPQAFGNPALLNCASIKVPVCKVEGGRTRKQYSGCTCR